MGRFRNPTRSYQTQWMLSIAGVCVVASTANAVAAEDVPTTRVRSREVALTYRLSGLAAETAVDLWYSRDDGATWHVADDAGFTASPIRFKSPAEGLYGFIIQPRTSDQLTTKPEAGTVPQRWVFIDATPPLAQWDAVEPCNDVHGGARRRTVRLSWTAYDVNFAQRPVSLWYKSSIEEKWEPINEAVANTGRYDWCVPKEVAGQITLKLIVRDRGGHSVERIHGPMPLSRLLPTLTTQPAVTSRPAATTQPADGASDIRSDVVASPVAPSIPLVDPVKRAKAEELCELADANIERGEFGVAAARYREALTHDPSFIKAMNGLAGAHLWENDYDKAIELYNGILDKDKTNVDALRGGYRAYLAQRKYPESRAMLERFLSVEKDDADAWVNLGDTLFRMNDLPGAREKWQQATRVPSAAKTTIDKARGRLEAYQIRLRDSVNAAKEKAAEAAAAEEANTNKDNTAADNGG